MAVLEQFRAVDLSVFKTFNERKVSAIRRYGNGQALSKIHNDISINITRVSFGACNIMSVWNSSKMAGCRDGTGGSICM